MDKTDAIFFNPPEEGKDKEEGKSVSLWRRAEREPFRRFCELYKIRRC